MLEMPTDKSKMSMAGLVAVIRGGSDSSQDEEASNGFQYDEAGLMKAVMVMSLVMMLVAVVIDMWDMMVILMGKVRVVCVTCRHDCNKNNDDYRHIL